MLLLDTKAVSYKVNIDGSVSQEVSMTFKTNQDMPLLDSVSDSIGAYVYVASLAADSKIDILKYSTADMTSELLSID